MYNFKNLCPFKWYVLENFPFIEADFDAITNWQLMCKLGEEINKIITKVNLTGEQVENLTNYVSNYFDNLDVQDEINNKLDEMAESGELQEIISQFLKTQAIIAFNNIEDLKNSTNLINGSFAKTYGKITYNDGLGSFYKIRNRTFDDVIDNDNIILITNTNLVAEKIFDNKKYVIIGDSYTEAYSPDGVLIPYTTKFKNDMNLNDNQLIILAKGGYGFARENNKFETIITSLTNDNTVTDVIFLSGYNDRGNTDSNIYNGILNCKNIIKSKYPNAIMHIGQIGGSINPQNILNLYYVTEAYKKSCSELNINYINNIEYTLHNYFYCFSSDGFHPNQTGQNQIAYSLEKYIKTKNLSITFPYTDYEATSEENFTLPNNLPNNLTMSLYNENIFISLKNYISITVNNLTMSCNGTKYKIGSPTNGYIIGSQLSINNIQLNFLIKSNENFIKVNGLLEFNNGGIFIQLLDINESKTNFLLLPSVTEILIPAFQANFNTNLC